MVFEDHDGQKKVVLNHNNLDYVMICHVLDFHDGWVNVVFLIHSMEELVAFLSYGDLEKMVFD